MRIAILEPQNPGNIGAIARAMKNFNFENLILINPKCEHLGKEAFDRASHAKDILEKAVIAKDLNYLKKFDYIIGTTAVIGTDYNIPRSPVKPEQLKFIKNSVILFGRESSGLTNKEINFCDFIVTIPTSKKYPTMNIAQAATIIFYELFKKSETEKIDAEIKPITRKEKEHLLKLINEKLDKLRFSTKEKREVQKTIWKKLIGKGLLTKREAFALFGFFKKI